MESIKAVSALFATALSPNLLAGCADTVGGSSSRTQFTPAASGDSSQQIVILRGIIDFVPHSEIIKYVTPKPAK